MEWGITMKYVLVFTVLFTVLILPTANAANSGDGYMEGHPSYNQDYYTPSYNNSHSTPNYDSNYYDRTYNNDSNYQNQDNLAPYGNDIRDYHPYYDRDGNLK